MYVEDDKRHKQATEICLPKNLPITTMGSSPLLPFLCRFLLILWVVDGARFSANGPVLTITLKDPLQTSKADTSESTRWIDVSNLRPHLVPYWGIQSQQSPLPNWLPALTGLGATVGYQYTDLKTLPSWVEGTVKFSRPSGELQLESSYEVKTGRTNLLVPNDWLLKVPLLF
jgi:hypothetical protein